jgi:hypothetical protein
MPKTFWRVDRQNLTVPTYFLVVGNKGLDERVYASHYTIENGTVIFYEGDSIKLVVNFNNVFSISEVCAYEDD